MEYYYDNKFIKFLFKDKIIYFKFSRTVKITVILTIYCFLMGLVFWIVFNNLNQYTLSYDECDIGKPCTLALNIKKDLENKKLYLYMRLEDFYVNHKLIIDSYSTDQLVNGKDIDIEKAKSDCGNFYLNTKLGDRTVSYLNKIALNPNSVMIPCGLKPFLFYKENFIFYYNNNTLEYRKTDIINSNYKNNKFKNVNLEKQWIDFKDEIFLQWMKTPVYKDFEILYGVFDNGLKKGIYYINIQNSSIKRLY